MNLWPMFKLCVCYLRTLFNEGFCFLAQVTLFEPIIMLLKGDLEVNILSPVFYEEKDCILTLGVRFSDKSLSFVG